MGQSIDTSAITHVANLLRHAAPAMPQAQDRKLFLKAAAALENRAAKIAHGTPTTSGGKVDLLV